MLDESPSLIIAVWEKGLIPAEWKHIVAVPILEPGKEADRLGSYRPIALTGVICKIIERMVTNRLVYGLDQKGYFSPSQTSFRLGQRTMDSVFVSDREIKKALVNKEVVVGVFLDIEKAYEML